MNFGEQIKKIRLENNLTQEQLAAMLHVSRQTISSWENNRNLPDLEMVVEISKQFHLSLDQLITGGNNMAEKLIEDGRETTRAKANRHTAAIGAFLLCLGALCIFLKGNTVEYIDAEGILHENFYLIPVGMFFMFSGLIVITATMVRRLILSLRKKGSLSGS